MNLSERQITEIVQELDCGLLCFFHKETGEIESIPSEDDPFFDPEPWQEVIDRIENDPEKYLEFSPMDSNDSYEVMENFTLQLKESEFKTRLLKILNRPKPFANFKIEVDESDFREDWFAFKNDAYIKFVEAQIELEQGK